MHVDWQGFPMKQGVLTADRVRLMMAKGEASHSLPPPPPPHPHCTHTLSSTLFAMLPNKLTRRGRGELPTTAPPYHQDARVPFNC